MARNITLAFAGNGAVKDKTVKALLDDFLGFGPVDADGYPEPSEHDLKVIFPASVEHYNEHLQTVVDWTEYADLPYTAVLAKGDRDQSIETLVEDAEKVEEVPNVDKTIVDMLAAAEGEAFLVLLWGDDDQHCEILLDLAETAGVKALDLTEGLDDLKFGDEEEVAPEPEPEPETPVRGRRGSRRSADKAEEPEAEEKPARGRRGRKEAEPEVEEEKPARRGRRGKEEALEDAEEELTDEADEQPAADPEPEPTPEPEPEAPKRRGRARAAAPVEEPKVEEPKVDETLDKADVEKADAVMAKAAVVGAKSMLDAEYLSGALQSIFLHLQAADAAAAYRNLGDPQESPVTALAREALEHVSFGIAPAAEEPVEEPKRGRGRPRTNPETVGYLKNEDGVYRKAGRGRPKRGEEKVDLTADEVAALQAEGLILDED